LLFKAGPEEVYQHVRGQNAAPNLARAARYYGARGVASGDDATSPKWVAAVLASGGREWLADPWRRQQLRELAADGRSTDRERRRTATRGLGTLLFRAGQYGEAQQLLADLARDHLDGTAGYYYAFALALGGDPAAGKQAARALAPQAFAALSPTQRYRLALLAR
jgi:hypothetical protein